MKLLPEEIFRIAEGVERIKCEDGTVRLFRFTEQQEALYAAEKPQFLNKVHATAGIKLRFLTDSETLGLRVTATAGSTRSYFSVDVTVNGDRLGCLDNFNEEELPPLYTKYACPLGTFSKEFSLGEGMKTVCIHLPWSVALSIDALTLDDGAKVKAVTPSRRMLVFGDSITQGYDARRPSHRYVARLAEQFDAAEYNKAIGGEQFYPALAAEKESFVPDIVTVAYGTNDWGRVDAETFLARCKAFFATLNETYPETPILAITPIWRRDCTERKEFFPFDDIEVYMRRATEGLANVIVLSGKDFVPADVELFADGRLHPNDEGFAHYAERLYADILRLGVLPITEK